MSQSKEGVPPLNFIEIGIVCFQGHTTRYLKAPKPSESMIADSRPPTPNPLSAFQMFLDPDSGVCLLRTSTGHWLGADSATRARCDSEVPDIWSCMLLTVVNLEKFQVRSRRVR